MSLSNTIVFLSLFYSFSLLESISGKLQNAANLGSYSQYLISFVFLSSPSTRDRAERCTPKTTAAARRVADVVARILIP